MVAGGVWLYYVQAASLRERAEAELAAIASLKIDQIESWRTQHLRTAERLTESRLYAEIIEAWLDDPSAETAGGIVARMRAEQPSNDYFEVLLVDAEGIERLRLGEGNADIHGHVQDAVLDAIERGEPALTHLHIGPGDLPAHIDVIAPLYYQLDGELVSPGAIVLQSAAEDFLYPLVQSWPTPSETAETALVARDGEYALFLNDLRHVDGAALELRIPLTESDNPAVMAVTGVTGLVEGVDYRGERVFAYLAPIEGSEWFMVTKIDVDEALAEWRARAAAIVALVTGLVVLIVAGLGLAWQRSRADQLGALLAAERGLREKEQELLSLFEAAPLGLGTTRNRVFTDVSDRFCEMAGYSRDELLGMDSRMLYVDDDEYERVGRELYSTDLQDGPQTVETTFVRSDGTLVDVLVSAAALDPGDAARGASFAALDISERKRVEEQVSEHNALLESLVRISQTPVASAEEYLGFVLGEALGMTGSTAGRVCRYDERSGEFVCNGPLDVTRGLAERMSQASAALRCGTLFDRVVEERRAVSISSAEALPADTPGSDASGSDVNCLAVPVFADDRVVAVAAVTGASSPYTEEAERRLSVLMDGAWRVIRRHLAEEEVRTINASLEQIVRERTEELQAINEELKATAVELHQTNRELVDANEAKTRFLRAMSHELRTPLNSIIGFSGIMLDGLAGEMTEEQRRQLEMINRSGRHQLDLINDILDLSRIEAGKVEMQIDRVDVAELAREVLQAVAPAAEHKGLAVSLALPDHGDSCGTIVSDPVKVRQVILNLLSNAVKFTEEGQVSLHVECMNGTAVRFAISDTGPGIPAEDHETIFGEFTQRQRTHAKQHQGTGLGLAISRGLAGLLGGTITLESTVGVGSTFTLELPLEHTP